MSESNSRRAALAAFVLFALLPTAGTAYWAYCINHPAHAERVARDLAQRLRTKVALGGVTYPRPGVTQYRDLAFTGEVDGDLLDCAIGRLRIQKDGRQWQVEAHAVSVDVLAEVGATAAKEENRAAAIIQWLLARAALGEGGMAVVRISDLSLRTPEYEYILDDATLRYYSDRHGRPHIAGVLQPSGGSTPVAIELLMRSRREPQIVAVHLRSGAEALPAPVMTPLVDLAGRLGEAAQLDGKLSVLRIAGGWEATFQGRVGAVDLRRLAAGQLPSRLSGTSDWSIDKLVWSAGRVREIRGSVTGGPGRISAQLLHSLAQEAGFSVDPRVPARGAVAYEKLAFEFFMKRGVLSLRGLGGTQKGNLLLAGPRRLPLLHGPLGSSSVTAFAQALTRVPRGTIVQASYESDRLIRVLPTSTPANPPTPRRGADQTDSP